MAIAITVKFLSGTDKTLPRMRAYCSLTKPLTVPYPTVGDSEMSEVEACARYAAKQLLLRINGISKTYGETYELDQYIVTYDGNRHFSLK